MLKLKDAKTYYESLGDDLVKGKNENFNNEKKSLWFNVGYWKHANSYQEAAENFADKLFEFGDIKENETLLDIGCGFGVQDIHWVKKYNVEKIIGINISPTQLKLGEKLVQKEGLENKIEFKEGDAVNLNFKDNSFDTIIALDCVYHFISREKFLKEAYRVLKPGGKIVFSDFLPAKKKKANILRKFLLNMNSVPLENLYPKEDLEVICGKIGFEHIKSIDISDGVFQGIAKYSMQRAKGKNSEDIEVKLNPEEDKKYRRMYNILGFNRCYMFSMQK